MYVCVCVYDVGSYEADGRVRHLLGPLMRADYDTMRALVLSPVPRVHLAQEQEEVPFLQVRL
jgi:hypothetical protein